MCGRRGHPSKHTSRHWGGCGATQAFLWGARAVDPDGANGEQDKQWR